MNKSKKYALELIAYLWPKVYCFVGSEMLTNTESDSMKFKNAKELAIAHLDSILLCRPTRFPGQNDTDEATSQKEAFEYYSNIKAELESLDVNSCEELEEMLVSFN